MAALLRDMEEHWNLRSPHTHGLPGTADYSLKSLYFLLKHLALSKKIVFFSKFPQTMQIRKLLNFLSAPSSCVTSHVFNYTKREETNKFLERNKQSVFSHFLQKRLIYASFLLKKKNKPSKTNKQTNKHQQLNNAYELRHGRQLRRHKMGFTRWKLTQNRKSLEWALWENSSLTHHSYWKDTQHSPTNQTAWLYTCLCCKKMYVHHGKGHPGSQRGPLATSLISSSRSILINSTNWARVYLQEQAATSRYSVAA